MTENPWQNLSPPTSDSTLSARRVDPSIRWAFFWAISPDRKYMLVLRHDAAASPSKRLPNMKGVEVSLAHGEKAGMRVLMIKLLDPGQRDIFYRLCLDIVSASESAQSEKEAITVAVSRAWRWHHLLRGGGSGHLSTEEQKGLIGELLTLERFLLHNMSGTSAVAAWLGPFGAPKDFEVGRICIEAKARRGASTPYVSISSESQLDTSGLDELYLYVVELDLAPASGPETFRVTDVASRIQSSLEASDPAALLQYGIALEAAGLRFDEDYGEFNWIEGEDKLFRVTDDFPRITIQSIPSGVSNVKYAVSISECEQYRRDKSSLEDLMRVATHAS